MKRCSVGAADSPPFHTITIVRMPEVTAKYNGIIHRLAFNGSLRLSTPYFVMEKIMMPNPPAIAGAMNQAANIFETPFQPQLTPSAPREAMPAPMTPPMIQCLIKSAKSISSCTGLMTYVVETGSPVFVATVSQVKDPIKAHNIPSMSIAGFCSNAATLKILLRMVSATRDPTRTAPANSITEAIIMACFIVREREETDVAKELATSFAPDVPGVRGMQRACPW